MKKRYFKPYTAQEVMNLSKTEEGQEKTYQWENAYRKGYIDGVIQVLKYRGKGMESNQILYWLREKLMAWRHFNLHQRIDPPLEVPWKELREAILEAHDRTCAYCGAQVEPMHVDHIAPVSRGGGYELENLVAACASCNLSKNDRYPDECDMYIKYPRYKEVVIVEEWASIKAVVV